MPKLLFGLACGLASILLVVPAARAGDLLAKDLTEKFHGKTAYIDFAPENAATGGGKGAIYYTPDGKVIGRMPDGKVRKGTRTIQGNLACLQWDGGPPPVCSRLVQEGGTIRIIGSDGKPRGVITRIVDGNAEKL